MVDFDSCAGFVFLSFHRYVGELISDAEADVREDDSYLFDLDNKVQQLLLSKGFSPQISISLSLACRICLVSCRFEFFSAQVVFGPCHALERLAGSYCHIVTLRPHFHFSVIGNCLQVFCLFEDSMLLPCFKSQRNELWVIPLSKVCM